MDAAFTESAIAKSTPSPELSETRATLEQRARKRFGKIPGGDIVAHVVEMTHDADFEVRAAALDALVRRMGFAERDGLRVAKRPARGMLGVYETERAKKSARPYRTELESVSPPRGSCDCPDFLRSSLGLCKHLLAVLDFVHRKAVGAQNERAPAKVNRGARLCWDPRLPLAGSIDRLCGLHLDGGPAPRSLAPFLTGGRIAPKQLAAAPRRREFLKALARADERGALGATPAARAVIRDEGMESERRTRAEANAKRALRELGSLGRKLYPYQREGVERFLRAGRLLLADDMGLGKTTQAVAACHALFRAGAVRHGILIVPAALKPQWIREWELTSDVPVASVDGTPDERAKCYRAKRDGFLIIGYEQLLRDFEAIRAMAPELVVLDEAQRIKNWATKTAAFVKALDPEYRLVLTGTPMENRLEELGSILDFVDDLALAPKWRLAAAYGHWRGGAGDGRAGAKNLTTLRARIAPVLLRRMRKEVLTQLPPRTDTRVPVAMTDRQREAHDALNQDIATLISISKQRPLKQAEFLRLMSLLTTQRIISNGIGQYAFEQIWPAYRAAGPDPALLEGLFAPKLIELRRLIEDLVIAQGRKVVIFSQWRRMLRLAEWSTRDILGAARVRPVFFTGAEKQAQRTRAIVDFHDEPDVRVMFLSDAGGVGLNLQRAASACINLELPWNPAVLEQRIGRIYRIGQKRPIDVFNLVSEYGIEARIADLVGQKRAMFSSVFEGTSDSVQFDGQSSFMSQIARIVDAPKVPEPAASAALEADADADAGEVASEGDASAAEADGVESASPPIVPAFSANELAGVLSGLRVERTEHGAIRIEAPPEAASALAALFGTMAKLVASAAES